MRHSEVPRGPSLHAFRPPYEQQEAWAIEALLERSGSFPRGTLILVRPLPSDEWDGVARVMTAVSQRFYREAVCLWTDLVPTTRAISFAQHARLLGVRASLHSGRLDREAIRIQLTDPHGFGQDAVAWCKRAGHHCNDGVARILSCLASEAIRHRQVKDVAATLSAREGTWRTTFRRAGIAPPGDWFQVFRIVGIANMIQREHDTTSTAEFATRFEFHDAAAVRRRLRTTIGATVSDVRRLLGWEWMLADAMRRRGLANP